MKKTDLKCRKDLEMLMRLFYSKIKEDEVLKDFFAYFETVKWETHIKLMVDFWDGIVFHEGNYDGSPLKIHKHLHKFKNMSGLHFNQWNTILINSVDELFEGDNAELLKTRAIAISDILKIKMGLSV